MVELVFLSSCLISGSSVLCTEVHWEGRISPVLYLLNSALFIDWSLPTFCYLLVSAMEDAARASKYRSLEAYYIPTHICIIGLALALEQVIRFCIRRRLNLSCLLHNLRNSACWGEKDILLDRMVFEKDFWVSSTAGLHHWCLLTWLGPSVGRLVCAFESLLRRSSEK